LSLSDIIIIIITDGADGSCGIFFVWRTSIWTTVVSFVPCVTSQ